jgi:heptosyltransferase-2
MIERPERILIIQLRHVGEIMFLTPMIRNIKQTWPDVTIDWLIERNNIGLIENHPLIDNKIVSEIKSFHDYLNLVKKLKDNQYDLIINFHRGEELSLLVTLASPKYIAGRMSRLFSSQLDIKFSRQGKNKIHVIDLLMKNIEMLGIQRDEKNLLELFLPGSAVNLADELWDEYNLNDKKVIGINPGASWETKRLRPSIWQNICKELVDLDYNPIIFGGPTDIEMVDEINGDLNLPNFAGKLSIIESAALYSKCKVFISGDSGPMHIAASQKIPCVAIFGPTSPILYSPYGVKYEVITSNSCPDIGQCILKKCHSKCMTSINVSQIVNAVKMLS